MHIPIIYCVVLAGGNWAASGLEHNPLMRCSETWDATPALRGPCRDHQETNPSVRDLTIKSTSTITLFRFVYHNCVGRFCGWGDYDPTRRHIFSIVLSLQKTEHPKHLLCVQDPLRAQKLSSFWRIHLLHHGLSLTHRGSYCGNERSQPQSFWSKFNWTVIPSAATDQTTVLTSVLRILKSQGAWPEQEPARFSPNEMEAGGMELSCPSATRQQGTPWSLQSDRDCQGAHVLLEVPGPAYLRMSVTAGEMKYSWPWLNIWNFMVWTASRMLLGSITQTNFTN